MLDPALSSALLDALQASGTASGITPGDLRKRLARTRPRVTLAEIQDGLHALWSQDRITVEPPSSGRRELRVRLAEPVPATASALPASGTSLGPDDSLASVCGQLASAYHEARSPETKLELARLLFNMGARRLEPDGSATSFLGRRHSCPKPLLPGAAVTVTESGWCLPSPSGSGAGDRLLSKSRVEPT